MLLYIEVILVFKSTEISSNEDHNQKIYGHLYYKFWVVPGESEIERRQTYSLVFLQCIE